MAASSSTGPQVFINYRGSDMGLGFLGFLVTALRNTNIKVFTDRGEIMGNRQQNLLVRIEQSQVALAIFSMNYSSSVKCLDELVKINECMDERGLIAIPIFYKIEIETVKNLSGYFGDDFRILRRSHLHEPLKTEKWEEALTAISGITGKHLQLQSSAGIEIATMLKVHWLKIVGNFTTSDLTPGKEYEVVFVVKLEDTACGWEFPVNLKLKLKQQGGSGSRGGKVVNLTKYRSHGWGYIRAGVFVAPAKNVEVKGRVTMSQYVTDDTKNGLVIKGVAILPAN